MAIKVGLEGNILKIDDGVKIEYLNASWCSITFNSLAVLINDKSKSGDGFDYSVLFTEFQDLASTPYATEASIATYLSDKIG